MDDFPGLLARDFGFKPQGRSEPMAPPRSTAARSSSPIFDDHDLFNNVFAGSHNNNNTTTTTTTTTSSSSASRFSSLPVFDKPVYDDDIFDGLPGIRSSGSGSATSAKFDDVFATGASQQQKERSPFDDLLGSLGKKESGSNRESVKVEKDSPVFDDLLAGFARSSSPSISSRSSSETSQPRKLSSNAAKTATSVIEDPFVVFESATTPPAPSSGLFADPLEEISKFTSTGNSKVNDSTVNKGVFDDDDVDPFDNLGRSVPPVSTGSNRGGKDRSPLKNRSSMDDFDSFASANKDPVDKYPVDSTETRSQKKTPKNDFQESHETLFDVPPSSTDFHTKSIGRSASPPSYANVGPAEANSSPRSEEIPEASEDIWLTVSEIPLFTQLTRAPPPSRPPPPRPPRISKSESGSFPSTNTGYKATDYSSFSKSNSYSQAPSSAHGVRSSVPSQMDELEGFAMGKTQNNFNEQADFFYAEEVDANSSAAAASAAAMKEAMDKAEAKFRQMREREYLKTARSKETGQPNKDMPDSQQRELRERQEKLERERQQRVREEEEREKQRLERERERACELEREREEKEREQRRIEMERDRGRQAVERATREARERAAAEARLKAERAAVEKVSAEARERAERAAVQRAQAEVRERAAAEARERAEKAAAEAREREAREKAAAAAKAEARRKAERTAVERAAAEARERAAAEARERAAAAARASQQKDDNDLESFFSSRASSAPRPRASSTNPFFDMETKGAPDADRKTSGGSAPSMRKASSSVNIVDDLSSIFGAPVSSGDFQEVEGESEERRRARLERHQRTQERAAKALAEKNQRDLQVQREQAERHRIAETLDVEVKRWAAGKEGNLRALLSTLQYVLWPECGWQPVSLTDLITGAAVKKVYRKATLCIHPDKVQQKGATLQQKYVAEKVFDLLKEAWNKFNSEELF